ncbi:3-dehydroquinate synthase-domain-containing protein [Dunaliella salina]|uniref:3-dehydroquinate synthase-domain-containing protein n=1 Tax=Dunaliella salina TaxID=3046 RepID=A0ABQ7GT15_DUNSA|nr:3-dehydroquinate synthase-domain-containing protein [Dunaliella salina]|eukprot:KAF5837718.1 3-dehydroquinate synthase-domain-containing protein [Dunaliella salina]
MRGCPSSCPSAGRPLALNSSKARLGFSRPCKQLQRNFSMRCCCSSQGSRSSSKELWVQTSNKATLTSAMECGISTFVFSEQQRSLDAEWAKLGRFKALFTSADNVVDGEENREVAKIHAMAGPDDLRRLERALLGQAGKRVDLGGLGAIAIMDASDWKVIPAENLVALAQVSTERAPGVRLFATADTAQEAEVMLGALEMGVQGVLLRTDNAAEVRALAKAVEAMQLASTPPLNLERATVTQVTPTGMGERVCVDLANMLVPGEGMLVGSFARGLLLVHSECEESEYIASRPFRCNAGAVHQYVASTVDRTAYLSELRSGQQVLVCNPSGRVRTALVGRSKLETRPMVMVGVRTGDGTCLSVMLQNAETVKLVGPSSPAAQEGSGSSTGLTASMPGRSSANASSAADITNSLSRQGAGGGGSESREGASSAVNDCGVGNRADKVQGMGCSNSIASAQKQSGPDRTEFPDGSRDEAGQSTRMANADSMSSSGSNGDSKTWRTLSVSALQPGDEVLVFRPKSAARHMGHAINEFIQEQ